MKRLTGQQRKFADNLIQNGGNASKAARDAGYSKRYARHASVKLCQNVRIFAYILARVRNGRKQAETDDEAVIANMYRLASGKNKQDRFKVTDHVHPEESTDKTVDAPPPTRDQVSAIELYLKYKGLEHSSSKPFEDAQIRGVKAKSYINEVEATELKRENEDKRKKKSVPVFQYLKDVIDDHYNRNQKKSKKSEKTSKDDRHDDRKDQK